MTAAAPESRRSPDDDNFRLWTWIIGALSVPCRVRSSIHDPISVTMPPLTVCWRQKVPVSRISP